MNHLAPFLLTHLLRERLLASGPARVVNVASDAHRFVPRGFDFDDPMSERGFGFPTDRHRHACLRDVEAREHPVHGRARAPPRGNARDRQRRASGRRGDAARHEHRGALGKLIPLALRPFFKTPAQGAATSLYVATSPELAKTNGRYFADCPRARADAARRATPTPRAGSGTSRCEWVGIAVEDTRWST